MKRALVKAHDIAHALNVNRATVYRWAQTGAIPAFRVGSSVRFDPELVAAALAGDLDTGRNRTTS